MLRFAGAEFPPRPDEGGLLRLTSSFGGSYRREARSWRIERGGGSLRYALSLAVLRPYHLVLEWSGEATPRGRDGLLSVLANGALISREDVCVRADFHLQSWSLPSASLRHGENIIELRLTAASCLPLIRALYICDFVPERQEHSQWCWAAAATSVAAHYGRAIRQRSLVRQLLGPCACRSSACGLCNRPWYVGDALKLAGVLAQALPRPLDRARLVKELRQGRPVVVVTRSAGATGHAAIISAEDESGDLVIWDPRRVTVHRLSYDTLVLGSGELGRWTNSFLTCEGQASSGLLGRRT